MFVTYSVSRPLKKSDLHPVRGAGHKTIERPAPPHVLGTVFRCQRAYRGAGGGREKAGKVRAGEPIQTFFCTA